MSQSSSIPFIVVGIDGTGSGGKGGWRHANGDNSSVYRFVHDFDYGSYGKEKLFLDGPSDKLQGIDSDPILQKALDFIYNQLRQLFPQIGRGNVRPLSMFDVNLTYQANERARADYASDPETGKYFGSPVARKPVTVTAQMLSHQPLTTNQVRVVIVGHSRGGLLATVLARMLSPVVQVYFLGLYDAVDRQPSYDAPVVENVKIVFHARRSPEVGSRRIFGNTATDYHLTQFPEKNEREKFFYTSHGGIGGSFEPGKYDNSWFADNSCFPLPPTRTIITRGGAFVVKNPENPLTKRFGIPIDRICETGSHQADDYIRAGARRYGLPIH